MLVLSSFPVGSIFNSVYIKSKALVPDFATLLQASNIPFDCKRL